ncbi:MAG TPA: RelA/SpoT family protein [Candidatus Saccharimonadales bacterium]
MIRAELLQIARLHYTSKQVALLERAIDTASNAHKDQKRRSGEPYIIHPLAVAKFLIEWGMDIDSVVAGVLHDTVEDTELTLEDIEADFGADIAFLVDGVTKVGQARSGMKDLENYLPQTKDNLSKLLIAVAKDVRVVIIKIADRLHNLQTLEHMPKEKQMKIARESLEVFAPMADRLGMGGPRMLIEELGFRYVDPKEFTRTQNLMKKRLGKSTRKLGKIREEVEKKLKEEHIDYEMDGRVKSVFSLYRKLKRVDGIDDIYDLMALRIIVDNKEDCYRVLGILHSMYKPMLERIKDYIAVPKTNGYQSLHTTVLTPSKQIVEFQVRSKSMHEYAEGGLAASFHYHEQKNSDSYVKRKSEKLPSQLQWITELQEIASKLRAGEDIPRDQLNIDLFGRRMFIYSPKGDIYNLPHGALPLDFAYLVHSDVGQHASSFTVNGKIHPFDKPLENGDIVEVQTKKLPQAKKAWLDLVKTSHAKSKLKAQLRGLGLLEGISNAAAIIREKARRKRKN